MGLVKLTFVPAANASLTEPVDESVRGDRPPNPPALHVAQTNAPNPKVVDKAHLGEHSGFDTFATLAPSSLLTQTAEPIEITDVRLETTETGLNIILTTASGPLSLPAPTIDGDSLVSDIPNAQLALPDGQAFEAADPAAGIAAISVTQLDDNLVCIRVVGSETTPVSDIQLQDEGVVLSVSTPAVEPDIAEEGTIRVVVTAEKTPEDPQDVPISLTVLTENELVDGQINSIAEVAANTPNFYLTPGDRVFNFYSLRGIGNANNILARDSVSFYIDDVPYDNVHQFFTSELFDLERVEILRGPQSTLYGRNSQAGVVNIISRAPSEEPEIRASTTVGSFSERQLQLAWSDSLIPDTLGIRLAGIYRANDGSTDNTLLDNDADEQNGVAGRFNLVWTPSDRWSVNFNATASSTRDDASVYVPVDQDDPFEIARIDNGDFDLETNTQSLRVGYEGDNLRFTSMTSRSDTDYSYIDVFDDLGSSSISDFDQEIFTQELRLQSPATADQFQWLVGAFFQNRDFRLGIDSDLAFFGTNIDESTYDQTTYAGFAQIDYKPIEALTLTAGLRYEYWREDFDRDATLFRSEDGTIAP
ncbi:MAG: TonB-dependent receptor, partial [Cyanobacteria bacterium J06559_3]